MDDKYDDDQGYRHKPSYDKSEDGDRDKYGDDQGPRVYVGGLSYTTDSQALKEHFSAQFPTVTRAQIIEDRDGRSKGFGFVFFTDDQSVSTAIDQMHRSLLDGREIIVNRAITKAERYANGTYAARDRYEREQGYGGRGGYSRGGGRGGSSYDSYGRGGGYSSGRGSADRGPPPEPKSVGFRVSVSGLPPAYGWRELKDFLRTAGQVTYADVKEPGFGIGEYATAQERSVAIRQLDGSSLENSKYTVHIKPLEFDGSRAGPPRDEYARRPAGGYSRPPYERDGGYERGYDRSYDRGYETGGGYDRGYGGGYGRGGYDEGRGGYGGGYGGERGYGGYEGGYGGKGGYDRGYDAGYDGGYGPRGGGGYGNGGGYSGGGGGYGGGYGGGSRGGAGGYEREAPPRDAPSREAPPRASSREYYDAPAPARSGGPGPDRNYSGSRGGGYERAAPY